MVNEIAVVVRLQHFKLTERLCKFVFFKLLIVG